MAEARVKTRRRLRREVLETRRSGDAGGLIRPRFRRVCLVTR